LERRQVIGAGVVKIAIIGAGSMVFMKNIVTDIVLEPGLETAHGATIPELR